MESVVRSYKGIHIKSARYEAKTGSLKEGLEKLLEHINSIKGVRASAIASPDGLIISSKCPQPIQDDVFAAMVAAMLKSAEGVAISLKQSSPERLTLETKQSKLIVKRTGPRALLSVLVDAKADLKKILLEVDTATEKVVKLL